LEKRAAEEEARRQAEHEARAREQAETNEWIKTLEQKLEVQLSLNIAIISIYIDGQC
jgi:hypothetical protein